MRELSFQVEKAEALAHAAAPTLNFNLQINEAKGRSVQAVALRCQIRIEPAKRRYEAREEERLGDLFGEPARWGQTLKSMLWTHAGVMVPPFEGQAAVDLPVACSADFNVAAAKYFYGVENGEVPLCFLFSGTVFYTGQDQSLQVAQISWDKEAQFRLPVSAWKAMMEHYYPNQSWLRIHSDVFERLRQFKARHGLATWEAALDKLLDEATDKVTP